VPHWTRPSLLEEPASLPVPNKTNQKLQLNKILKPIKKFFLPAYACNATTDIANV
jgi:hypothetical protein